MATGVNARTLPRLVSVAKSAQKKARYSGLVPAAGLEQLLGAVNRLEPAAVEFDFDRAESGLIEIKVAVAVNVEMTCQRCLAPVNIPLASTTVYTVVDEEQARERLQDLNPLVLNSLEAGTGKSSSDELDLHDLAAQEISLALPLIAMHEGDELAACKARVKANLGAAEFEAVNDRAKSSEESVAPAMRRPFAELDVLLKKQGDSSSQSS